MQNSASRPSIQRQCRIVRSAPPSTNAAAGSPRLRDADSGGAGSAMREQGGEIDAAQRPRLAEIVALRVVSTGDAQRFERGEAVDVFADHAQFERLRELRDRA